MSSDYVHSIYLLQVAHNILLESRNRIKKDLLKMDSKYVNMKGTKVLTLGTGH